MFKQCTVCSHIWETRQAFISDPGVCTIGYQANFKELEAGLLFFNHRCKNTIAVPAAEFVDLYEGPMFEESKAETDDCPGYCLNKDELQPCPAECECAYIRTIIQLIAEAKNK